MKKTRKLFVTLIFLVIAAMALTGSAFAATGEATVTAYMLNMREGQGMEFTIVDVAYEGNTVLVTEDDGSGWVKVNFNGQIGYMNKLFLAFKETEEPAVAQTYTAPTVTEVAASAPAPAPAAVVATANANATVKGDGVNMRSGPNTSSSVLEVLYNGTAIRVNGICGKWYEVNYNGKTGYIKNKYVNLNGDTSVSAPTVSSVAQQAGAATETQAQAIAAVSVETKLEPAVTPAPTPTPAPTATPAPAKGSGTAQSVVDTAMKCIGVPYRWAGTSPQEGFDCSGLVYYAFQQNGITVNRVAQSMYYNGKAVNLEKLKPGDILLFGSSVYDIWHAGLYVGNGQFIHSPHSGATVRVENLSDLYGMRLVAARRVV